MKLSPQTLMHRIFQTFVDRLWESIDAAALQVGMAEAAAAFDFHSFAYLAMPNRPGSKPRHISTYPADWTAYYLRNHYERLDPVVTRALSNPEPFDWGLTGPPIRLSRAQQQLFDEAAEFGIRCGFTTPIHDRRGPVAAITFATDEQPAALQRRVEKHGRVLQLMAIYFHAHARRKLIPDRIIDGVPLSPRELECLEWAARGKSAWEIGRILGISRRTAVFHLENAKTKLGVRSICQAVARLTASRQVIQ